MNNNDFYQSGLFEHRFWLQIMGDHARFIFYSLAPSETKQIRCPLWRTIWRGKNAITLQNYRKAQRI